MHLPGARHNGWYVQSLDPGLCAALAHAHFPPVTALPSAVFIDLAQHFRRGARQHMEPQAMSRSEYKALFLSHGGGPLPLLGDDGHREMTAVLQSLATRIGRPAAVIVVSAHWEQAVPTLTAGAQPPLIYDYHGFPAEAYKIEYACAGSPALAEKAVALLRENGLDARLDPLRGFDHGLFVPLKIMYPDAGVPCIQLSLMQGLDPAAHIEMGAALRGLEDGDLLLIGSGFSFHNMRAFFEPGTSDIEAKNMAFEHWLIDTCSDPQLPESQRRQRLENWEQAPSARFCHPREEHLLPLLVCYGATQAACREYFELRIMNRRASMYLW